MVIRPSDQRLREGSGSGSGGLQDGENFDGQSSSNFSNLNSVTTDFGTIDGGDDIPGIPASSSSASPGFGNWTQVSSDRPALVVVDAQAETDGSTNGAVDFEVDESGGTTADYSLKHALVFDTLSNGTIIRNTVGYEIPAGAQYRIVNEIDPNNNNTILTVREFDK